MKLNDLCKIQSEASQKSVEAAKLSDSVKAVKASKLMKQKVSDALNTTKTTDEAVCKALEVLKTSAPEETVEALVLFFGTIIDNLQEREKGYVQEQGKLKGQVYELEQEINTLKDSKSRPKRLTLEEKKDKFFNTISDSKAKPLIFKKSSR